MSIWAYKVITSGKGGFATPALLESFLNQLGADGWEILQFQTQPDNALAFTGLARRPTQRDWTLEDAAATAARAEVEKLRAEFEAKFKGTAAAGAEENSESIAAEKAGADDGLRRLRDTESDGDNDAAEEGEEADDWEKLTKGDELPTFFEAIQPLMRRNQRGAGLSAGVDHLAKKWGMAEADVVGALKECGFTIPEDEDARPVYVEYDGDLYWVNVNRRGELWINTKEKSRPVFRVVAATPVNKDEAPVAESQPAVSAEPDAGSRRSAKGARVEAGSPPAATGAAEPLPSGPALLEKIRPLMRRNRRGPGGSGSLSFLSRALKCAEADLMAGFAALGLALSASPNEKPVLLEIAGEEWWLNQDSRGGVWINGQEKAARGPDNAEAAAGLPEETAARPADGAPLEAPRSDSVLAAVRLLLKPTKTGAVAAEVGRLAETLARSPDEFLAALTGSGLKVPEKPRAKPVFVEHAGEIFWLNQNARNELWLNAKPSKFAADGPAADKGGRRGRTSKKTESATAAAEPQS